MTWNLFICLNIEHIQFQKVEKFTFHEYYDDKDDQSQLPLQFSESLRYLSLRNINLNSNFDWTQLKRYLKRVNGINVQNFIEFLHQRPNLEVFHHDENVFKGSTQFICETMSEYSGNQILIYSGEMFRIHPSRMALPRNLYSLTRHQKCGSDLIEAMKGLDDTIETLYLRHAYDCCRNPIFCKFQQASDLEGFDMSHFSHLKTIKITG